MTPRGEKTIKKFLITLTALAAIVCGAVYVVLNPPHPVIRQVERKEPKHLLPYEQQLATRKSEEAPKSPADGVPQAETAKATQDAAPGEPDKQAAAEQAAPAPQAESKQSGQSG